MKSSNVPILFAIFFIVSDLFSPFNEVLSISSSDQKSTLQETSPFLLLFALFSIKYLKLSNSNSNLQLKSSHLLFIIFAEEYSILVLSNKQYDRELRIEDLPNAFWPHTPIVPLNFSKSIILSF